MAAQRPNILFVMADQMAAAPLPFHGGRVVKAPHLSVLASRGVVFEGAYCASPLCAPSRFSMLAGRRASAIGAYDNAAHFAADVPTIAHHLRHAGYRTVLAGKMHFVGPDQLHGYEERITTDIYPADFGWTPNWDAAAERIDWWYHNMLSVVQAGVCETSNQLDFDDEVAFQATRKLHELARDGDGRPFFLTVSFTHPHDPYAIRQAYWDRYDHAAIDLPRNPTPFEAMDPHSKRLWKVSDMGRWALTEARVRNARHAYYGAISYIDDRVGELMAALRASGQAENTVVVFTADHGDLLGEHGLWYKMHFYEGAVRVPLLMAWPGRWRPARIAAAASHLDLLPTLAAIAGSSGESDGRNLLPALEGGAIPGEDAVVSEYLAEGAAAPVVMLRRGPYKLIHCPLDPPLLFDVVADPDERSNLATQPAHAGLLAGLMAEVARRWDLERLNAEVLASQRRRRFVYQALRAGQFRSWDFQPFADASRQYMRNHLDLNDLERRARFPTPDIPPPDGPDIG